MVLSTNEPIMNCLFQIAIFANSDLLIPIIYQLPSVKKCPLTQILFS